MYNMSVVFYKYFGSVRLSCTSKSRSIPSSNRVENTTVTGMSRIFLASKCLYNNNLQKVFVRFLNENFTQAAVSQAVSCQGLHSGFLVFAGTGTFVLALGCVEVVADGDFHFLGVQDVGLPEIVIAKVGGDIVVAQSGQI